MTQETINQVLKFRDDRDWKQFHNPKDLANKILLTAMAGQDGDIKDDMTILVAGIWKK